MVLGALSGTMNCRYAPVDPYEPLYDDDDPDEYCEPSAVVDILKGCDPFELSD